MADITQWEYRVEIFGSAFRGVKPDEMEAALNAWGEEGWEVIDIRQPQGSNKIWVTAKRLLTERRGRTRQQRGW